MRALYGRIMRMGMARITRMGALCVRYGGSVERWGKVAETRGAFRGVNASDKKGCQWKNG